MRLGTYRFVLAAMVVAVHSQGYAHGLAPDVGLAAVGAFFFVSGYLMPATLARNYVNTGPFWEGAKRYIFNRLLRVYPAYWLSLIVIGALLYREGKTYDAATVGKQVLLFGLNLAEVWGSDIRFNGPAWTLDIELQYYLLCPLLLYLYRRNARSTLLALALCAALGLYLTLFPSGLTSLDRSLLAWCPLFVLGFLLSLGRLQLHTVAACLMALGSMVGMVRGDWTFPLLGSLSVFAAFLLTRGETRFSVWLGDLSYPLYVFHTIVASFFPLKAGGWVPHFAYNLFVSTALAIVAHHMLAWVDKARGQVRSGCTPGPQARSASAVSRNARTATHEGPA